MLGFHELCQLSIQELHKNYVYWTTSKEVQFCGYFIFTTYLFWEFSYLSSDMVDQSFGQEDSLRQSKPSQGCIGRFVGLTCLCNDVHIGTMVTVVKLHHHIVLKLYGKKFKAIAAVYSTCLVFLLMFLFTNKWENLRMESSQEFDRHLSIVPLASLDTFHFCRNRPKQNLTETIFTRNQYKVCISQKIQEYLKIQYYTVIVTFRGQ